MAVEVGQMAPDFTLPSHDGQKITLSQYRGKQAVVFAWYPAAFTAG
ncbi:MAG: redoxin domain-containing protein [Chloroflexi bacterium]|nr:redoxin domain-containing protein [Chloroflexota bacterium]